MGRSAQRAGAPPLRPFGLVLRHDGSWTHDGQPILNRRLREAFDRGVRFLPGEGESGEGVFVVTLGQFRGQIEVEEAAFFVRAFDPQTGSISLSDGSSETLDVGSLRPSPRDGALLCRVKRDLGSAELLARFTHSAQAALLDCIDDTGDGPVLMIGDNRHLVPEL